MTLPAAWLDGVRARLHQPPLQPRVPLSWQGQVFGSVEPALLRQLHAARTDWTGRLRLGAGGAELVAATLQPELDALALALRECGLAHVWRDEALAVRDAAGRPLGTIERAVVRPLGIATSAVHLVGTAPRGGHWIQLRSLTKANDPGLWDTLVGGMVPAQDTVLEALARETWEEAGLRLDQLSRLAHGGRVQRRGPTADVRGGYVVEDIDWYRCDVPPGVEPCNRDGEVERFEAVDEAELLARLAGNSFTLEAAAIYAQVLAAGPT